MSAAYDFYQGEVFTCPSCKEEHDAETNEVGAYMCKYLRKNVNMDEALKKICDMYGVKYE